MKINFSTLAEVKITGLANWKVGLGWKKLIFVSIYFDKNKKMSVQVESQELTHYHKLDQEVEELKRALADFIEQEEYHENDLNETNDEIHRCEEEILEYDAEDPEDTVEIEKLKSKIAEERTYIEDFNLVGEIHYAQQEIARLEKQIDLKIEEMRLIE